MMIEMSTFVLAVFNFTFSVYEFLQLRSSGFAEMIWTELDYNELK